jgi:predicted esterase
MSIGLSGTSMTLARQAVASAVLFFSGATLAQAPQANASPPGGAAQWISTDYGQIKTRIYTSREMRERPTLLVILHGDIPNPQLIYHYYMAQLFAEGAAGAAMLPVEIREYLGDPFLGFLDKFEPRNVVAAAILRPGYSDYEGDRSDGELGMALADNYTPEVVDAVANAVGILSAEFAAEHVILIGHSGGGAIAANLLGRHPNLADGALLIACGCDPLRWREEARNGPLAELDWDHPYRSLSPLELAPSIPVDTEISLLIAENDDVVSADYSKQFADSLRRAGGRPVFSVVAGAGHNDVVFTQQAFEAMQMLVEKVRGSDSTR